MKKIRKSKARNDGFASASLDLPHGALMEVKATKIFGPKFDEETGDFWIPKIRNRNKVIDDRDTGEADGLEFDDDFELKLDPDLDFDPEDIRNANIRDLSEEEQKILLDENNWTIGEGSKADMLNTALYGRDWAEEIDFHPEIHWVGKRFIAKVKPRTGKKPGSYCGWDTFMSVDPPAGGRRKSKKTSRTLNGKAKQAQEVELTAQEQAEMETALGSTS